MEYRFEQAGGACTQLKGEGGLLFEQRPRETSKAYAAFKVYLDMGPERSLSKTAKAVGKKLRLMEYWSRKWDWQGRLAAIGRDASPRGPLCPPVHQPGRDASPRGPHHKSGIINPESPQIANHKSQIINPESPLLTRRELANLLKVSTRTIDRMVADGHIPAVRLGKLIRFHWPDVIHHLAKN